jgi:protein-S-isoprenylcysteine O-methyltransferase Ste14
MYDESWFRIALAMVILVTMAIGIPHRIRAASSGERLSRKEEGYLMAVTLRIAGLLLAVSTLTHLLFPVSVAWAVIPIPAWLRWIGAITAFATMTLFYWTLASLGKNLTDTVVTRRNAVLVTHGPYHWVRHPFYVCAALLMTSVTVLTASLLICVGSLMVLSLLAIRTPKEERLLIERFGDEYRNYMKTTGKFIPRF